MENEGFKFKVELCKSPGKGLGVFAREFIPCGSLVWTLTDNNHRTFNEEELRKFVSDYPDNAQFVLNHIYGWRDIMVLALDDAAFVNHSTHSNLTVGHVYGVDDNEKGCFASRDIEPGEEILDNYSLYSTPQWYLDLCKEYNVESSKDVCDLYG